MECVFCKIINKELPSETVYEDKEMIVFKNIKPSAPIHLLIVPKKHILSVNHLDVEDRDLVGKMVLLSQKIARDMKVAFPDDIEEAGYKLEFNVGRKGGQVIDHLHLHFLSGWEDKEEALKIIK